jgi:hypothetical protein
MSGSAAVEGALQRPKSTGFMVGWLVFLGFYQILFAWKFGSFFEGTKGDLRHYEGGVALEPLYAVTGILALTVAWGLWHLRPWAYRLGFVLQGLIFALALVVIILWVAGKRAPIGWILMDCVFGAYNVWWALQPETRRAFTKQPPGPSHVPS